jgi:hypothetical protein
MSRVGRILNMTAVVLVFAYGINEYVVPRIVLASHKEEYQSLMFQCDHVMREHFIAKQQVLVEPSEMAVKNLDAGEVSLLTCHDYDKLRKKMLSFGVSEPQLSMIGLEVMEEKMTDVRHFVETHEIRY